MPLVRPPRGVASLSSCAATMRRVSGNDAFAPGPAEGDPLSGNPLPPGALRPSEQPPSFDVPATHQAAGTSPPPQPPSETPRPDTWLWMMPVVIVVTVAVCGAAWGPY